MKSIPLDFFIYLALYNAKYFQIDKVSIENLYYYRNLILKDISEDYKVILKTSDFNEELKKCLANDNKLFYKDGYISFKCDYSIEDMDFMFHDLLDLDKIDVKNLLCNYLGRPKFINILGDSKVIDYCDKLIKSEKCLEKLYCEEEGPNKKLYIRNSQILLNTFYNRLLKDNYNLEACFFYTNDIKSSDLSLFPIVSQIKNAKEIGFLIQNERDLFENHVITRDEYLNFRFSYFNSPLVFYEGSLFNKAIKHVFLALNYNSDIVIDALFSDCELAREKLSNFLSFAYEYSELGPLSEEELMSLNYNEYCLRTAADPTLDEDVYDMPTKLDECNDEFNYFQGFILKLVDKINKNIDKDSSLLKYKNRLLYLMDDSDLNLIDEESFYKKYNSFNFDSAIIDENDDPKAEFAKVFVTDIFNNKEDEYTLRKLLFISTYYDLSKNKLIKEEISKYKDHPNYDYYNSIIFDDSKNIDKPKKK